MAVAVADAVAPVLEVVKPHAYTRISHVSLRSV